MIISVSYNFSKGGAEIVFATDCNVLRHTDATQNFQHIRAALAAGDGGGSGHTPEGGGVADAERSGAAGDEGNGSGERGGIVSRPPERAGSSDGLGAGTADCITERGGDAGCRPGFCSRARIDRAGEGEVARSHGTEGAIQGDGDGIGECACRGVR